jgi:hypothetical protein
VRTRLQSGTQKSSINSTHQCMDGKKNGTSYPGHD